MPSIKRLSNFDFQYDANKFKLLSEYSYDMEGGEYRHVAVFEIINEKAYDEASEIYEAFYHNYPIAFQNEIGALMGVDTGVIGSEAPIECAPNGTYTYYTFEQEGWCKIIRVYYHICED